MSNVKEGKGGWSRRRVLLAAIMAPAIAAIPGISLAQASRAPLKMSKVSLADISYGFRFIRKGDVVRYWVRAVPMQNSQNVPVSVVFGTATTKAVPLGLAVDQQTKVYKKEIVLTKANGYSQRGGFRTSTKNRKLSKGQSIHCQVLFESGTQASDVCTFKV